MKFWLLERAKGLPADDNPWVPWYDKAAGFIVRAETEAVARMLANDQGGDETGPERELFGDRYGGDLWLNPHYSTCVELTLEGEATVILRDFEQA